MPEGHNLPGSWLVSQRQRNKSPLVFTFTFSVSQLSVQSVSLSVEGMS